MDKLLQSGFRKAGLGPRELALCRYAEKLSLTPAAVGKADLDQLRQLGLSDQDLLDLVQIIGYFNYINRVAEGLGVPPEGDWTA